MHDKVFKNKKKLEGKCYSITESLTALRMEKLTEACNSFGFTNVWTRDGKILHKATESMCFFLFFFFLLIVCRVATRKCSLKISAPNYFYMQRYNSHL